MAIYQLIFVSPPNLQKEDLYPTNSPAIYKMLTAELYSSTQLLWTWGNTSSGKFTKYAWHFTSSSLLLPGPHPTNDISVKFKFWSKLKLRQFKVCSTDYNEILHTSRQ